MFKARGALHTHMSPLSLSSKKLDFPVIKILSVESLLLIAEALGVEPFELMPGQAEIKRRRAEVAEQVADRLRGLAGSG